MYTSTAINCKKLTILHATSAAVAIAVTILFTICVTPSHSFTIANHHHHHHRTAKTTQLYQSSSPSSSSEEERNEKRKINNEQFLENTSKNGYANIKSMSIEERTKRAMLAEAAEDRVVLLSEELETLLGDDGMPKTVEDREEVTILAKQIKASMEQYKNLVNGDYCSSLDMFDLGDVTSDKEGEFE